MLKPMRNVLCLLTLSCLCLSGAPLLAAPAAPAPTPAPVKAEAAKPAAKTYLQYLKQLEAQDKAAVEAILAKRAPALKELKGKLRTGGKELKDLWQAAQFDAAKFAAKSKEVNDLAHKLNQLRLEEAAEVRAKLGAKLPFPRAH